MIPRAREPRPIVNSGEAADAGLRRERARVTEGIFLAKIFFHGAYLACETRRSDEFSAVSPVREGDLIRPTEFREFSYVAYILQLSRTIVSMRDSLNENRARVIFLAGISAIR